MLLQGQSVAATASKLAPAHSHLVTTTNCDVSKPCTYTKLAWDCDMRADGIMINMASAGRPSKKFKFVQTDGIMINMAPAGRPSKRSKYTHMNKQYSLQGHVIKSTKNKASHAIPPLCGVQASLWFHQSSRCLAPRPQQPARGGSRLCHCPPRCFCIFAFSF